MKKNKELENISKILRDHLHLTAAEVEGFLESSLDSPSTQMVEDHLRSCHHCAREVELIREIVSEQEPSSNWLFGLLGIGKILPLRPREEATYDRLWIGDENYSLSHTKEHGELLDVEGLYLSGLLKFRRQDRNDPGSLPVAVEGPGLPPVIASLSSLEAAEGFTDPLEDEPRSSDKAAAADFRLFVPIMADAGPQIAGGRRFKSLPGKGKKTKKSRPILILSCHIKSHSLELFHEPISDKIFLKIESGEMGRR